MEGKELSWWPSRSNSLWQGWSCRLVHCPGGNATDPIWRVLASSQGISLLTPLKPQHSNPNPLDNQLWCIDFLTPPTPLIMPHRSPAFLESVMPLKNWCSIHTRCSKSNLMHSICFCGIFPSLKGNFIAYRSSNVSDCIFEIHQLWQSGFSRVYSNCCSSCSFEAEIINMGQSSHKMYSNKLLNFQVSTTILNASMKKVWKLIVYPSYMSNPKLWGKILRSTGWSLISTCKQEFTLVGEWYTRVFSHPISFSVNNVWCYSWTEEIVDRLLPLRKHRLFPFKNISREMKFEICNFICWCLITWVCCPVGKLSLSRRIILRGNFRFFSFLVKVEKIRICQIPPETFQRYSNKK